MYAFSKDPQNRSETDLFKTQVAQLFGTKYPARMNSFKNLEMQAVLQELNQENE